MTDQLPTKEQFIYRATSKAYPHSHVHFGDFAAAKAWAGEDGSVEPVSLQAFADLRAVSQSSDPLPCPFCGARNISVIDGDTFRWRIAQCNECEARAPMVRIQTMGEGTPKQWEEQARIHAIAEWNTRAS